LRRLGAPSPDDPQLQAALGYFEGASQLLAMKRESR
jgi:hypothetical protein